MNKKTAIIVISHNSKEITTELCDKIYKYTKCQFDLIVVETGSNKSELTDYPTLWLPNKCRMTRGINHGIDYFIRKENYTKDIYYDSFWIVVNDTKIENDILTPMVEFLRNNNVGEIHPSIKNSPSQYLKSHNKNFRKESFCEIVCPLFSRKAIDLDLFDDDLFYGWGLDFTIPYILFQNNLNLYICDNVSVIHNAGTTTKSGKDEDFKTVDQQFNASRNNMNEVLTKKYGKNWPKIIYDSIPIDVSKDSYVDWIVNIGSNCKKEDLL